MNVLIVGGTGGIGNALVEHYCASAHTAHVVATWFRHPPQYTHPKLSWQQLDVCDEPAIAQCWPAHQALDVAICTVGILHRDNQGPEKSVRRITADHFIDSMRINALPALLLAQALHPSFKKSTSPVFAVISARVGSISDNRKGGWYSYRCSKAALNMAVKTLGIEWQYSLPKGSVALLHPGTTDTELSAPFQAGVPSSQLFTPQRSAAQLVQIIDRLSADNTAQFWSWDGSILPW